MHVRIRMLTSGSKDLVLMISKTALIEELQSMIFDKLNVEIHKQQLLYAGKLLVPEHRVVDYGIRLNDVIQLSVRENLPKENKNVEFQKQNEPKEEKEEKVAEKVEVKSRYFKNGDKIDVIDDNHGAWFEAKIINIYAKNFEDPQEEDLIFKIKMDRNVETAPLEVKFSDIRPRAHHTFKRSELEPGMLVFVNYNIEKPLTRGFWYDFKIIKIENKTVKGALLVGRDHTELENCTIKFVNEIMRIEKSTLLTERTDEEEDIPLRQIPLYCKKCKDDPNKKCKECGCFKCGKKDSEGVLILCDECDQAYHLSCLSPQLSNVPDGDWYCPDCKTDDSEIVKAGEKLKSSKKKLQMVSNKEGAKTRDWGRGMACVGKTTDCTIVPKHHYGPIPGVEVGMCWKYRVQVAESGVHRPPVAGIHGRENDGAYSLVLSGGYEDDVDNGEEFFYTGSGGRDLSGNKRVSAQTCNQELTKMNKALALNCNCPFNDKKGGEAKDWKKGKPVRVVRNSKLEKHSKFAPEDGLRYDGIYKVVKYFPQKGKSGFIVWRYLLRRDDATPPPWEKGAKKFPVIYPPGSLEAETIKNKKDKEKTDRKGKKRKQEDQVSNSLTNYLTTEKKLKIESYKVNEEVQELIESDVDNEKLWKECLKTVVEGKQNFLSKVEQVFLCVCCQEVVFQPITLTCKHNVCKSCLNRSFAAQIYVCPCCRFGLGEKYYMQVNNNLGSALKVLFPGYDAAR